MTLARMFRVMAGYVGARFFGAGLGLLTQIVLARLLSQSDVGTVLMAMSAAAFISLFAIGGHAMLATTELPKIMALGSIRRIRAFHGASLQDGTYGLLFLSLLVAGLVWLSPLSDSVKLALVFGLATAPASGLMRYNSVAANSHRRFQLSYVPDFIVRPGLFLAIIAGLWLTGATPGAVATLVIFACVGTAVALGQAFVLGYDGLLPLHWRRSIPRFTQVIRARAFALVIVSTVTLAFADIVTLLAGLVLPPEDVAIVGIAIRLAAIAGFVLQATQMFVLPDFTAAITRRNEAAANALLWKMTGMTIAVVGAGLVATILLGERVLHIFGSEYGEGAWLLVLFMIGQSIRALGGMNQNLLSIHGKQLRTAWACVLALLVLVVLTVILSRLIGRDGIGYAVIAAECVWLLGLATQANLLIGRRGDLLWLVMNDRRKADGQ